MLPSSLIDPFSICSQCPHPTIEEFVTAHQLVQPQLKEKPWCPTPQSRLGRFLFCFVAELFSFFIIASNFRALARGLYVWTAVTDGLCVLQGMIMTKLMIGRRENAGLVVDHRVYTWGNVRLRTFDFCNQASLGRLKMFAQMKSSRSSGPSRATLCKQLGCSCYCHAPKKALISKTITIIIALFMVAFWWVPLKWALD